VFLEVAPAHCATALRKYAAITPRELEGASD
jgi:hypothetical protein